MLRNLQEEMKRNCLTSYDIGTAIEKTERSARDKINGVSMFDIREAVKVRDQYFPGLRLEYLFFDDGTHGEDINRPNA